MAENAPPATAVASTTNGTAPSGETRGLPYYEKLRRDLRETIARKRQLDKSLAIHEEKILRFENKYLEETQSAGNIVRGFDNYIKGTGTTSSVITGGGTSSRRRANIIDQDRIFSGSSVGTLGDSPGPPSVSSTPHATTPSGGAAGTAAATSNSASTPTSAATPTGFRDKNLKKRKGADEDTDDTAKGNKRVRVTFGGIGS